ncbi:phage antirepressor N-terminal domain-containing protein [uncultured Thiodictyon sp.]|uniref:phage antirepressor N-terminal domain-containing protein n=1 Tax=uncultured Thiodictyon sp. TaxID=1846217 RepID=UPI0025F1E36C|nr:phage antirepressor N-terminal domain-containing protein [uncultured Thiodictyon sp.]
MSQDNSVLPVPFRGATLSLIDHNGAPFVAMRPIVEAMGMTWQSQHIKIKERYTSTVTEIVTVAEDGKQRPMTCLPLCKIGGWLMTVHANKVRPDLRDTILAYQAECDEVLWNYWSTGQATRSPAASPAAAPVVDPAHPPITIAGIAIRQDVAGRYCITDVHLAAGGDDQHRPTRWLQRQHTIALIKECDTPDHPAVVAKTGYGTFATKPVILAYGLSVSLAFHLRVSQAFESATAPAASQPADGPLLPSEQQALAAVIGARCEGRDGTTQEQVSAGLWASLQRQFHIVEPAELPRSKLAEAIVYLTALPVAPTPAPALPAPAAPAEVLTRADLANLDRVLGLMTDHQFRARAWRFAIWRALRAVTGTRAPQPFEVRHLPAMCSELRRIYAASAAWEEAVYKAEADLLRRVFRDGEDFEQVIAEQGAEQLAAGVERGAQLILELSHGRMAEISKLYARVPSARRDPRPDLQE